MEIKLHVKECECNSLRYKVNLFLNLESNDFFFMLTNYVPLHVILVIFSFEIKKIQKGIILFSNNYINKTNVIISTRVY